MPIIFASVRQFFTDTISFSSFVLLLTVLLTLLLPATGLTAQQVEQQPQTSDVRVLIDVSGSMKKNDPANLRLPALRLLVGLLPPDSTAGVWTFGTRAEPLIRPGVTNNKWKAEARKASTKIHSRDLFTNIGLALEAAIADWGDKPSRLHQRSIILLTDGMIDISKDKSKNAAERKRILTTLLARIEKTGASIHTIALSANADHDFLQQLSTKTDGGYEQTDNAEQLERIFLRLFEKTTRRDTVPLVNNTFLVDDSIMELTLLVFKPKGAKPTEVVEPGRKKYTRGKKPSYVKWQAEKNYDLITISRPKPGEWSINAQTDPDNRVMIVTNLQIQTNRIPNNLFAGETLNISLFMTNDNKKITDDDFLQFISFSARQTSPNKKRWFLHDNGLRGDAEAHDGIYNVQVRKTLEIGKNNFVFQASSETFQREINHSVLVHDINLISTRVDQIQKGPKNYHQIFVSPNLEFINARKMKISAQLIENGQPRNIELNRANPPLLEWSYESDALDPDKDYQIVIHMLTRTRSGRPVNYTSRPIPLTLPKFDNLLLEPETEKPQVEKAPEKIAETAEPAAPAEEDSGWMMGIIIAVIVNLIVGIIGWLAWRKWKLKRELAYEELMEELE